MELGSNWTKKLFPTLVYLLLIPFDLNDIIVWSPNCNIMIQELIRKYYDL